MLYDHTITDIGRSIIYKGRIYMSDIALQIERSSAGSVVVGEPVIFETTVYSAGNISYNSATGTIYIQ